MNHIFTYLMKFLGFKSESLGNLVTLYISNIEEVAEQNPDAFTLIENDIESIGALPVSIRVDKKTMVFDITASDTHPSDVQNFLSQFGFVSIIKS